MDIRGGKRLSAVSRSILSSLILVFLISAPSFSLVVGAQRSGIDEEQMTAGPYIPTGPWDRDTWTRYRNLNDTLNEIMLLKEKFPNILRVYNLSSMFRFQNGTPRYSIQGRTIWGLKISDDPDINDTAEPEIFYCAMTHAREWITNEALMYYINYVLHNYLVNSTINDIVNNTQMWFIPIVNPDGFQYSIDRDDFNKSFGIYGWRKNVNETNGISGFQDLGYGDGDGVDLNRNFGYQWMGPGSSTDPNDILYRGSSPFSEPETQIIRELATSRNFTLGLSFHSYSGLNLYPWGHTTNPAPDANLMKEIATGMSRYNGYTPTQGANLYPVNGDIGDYMYGSLGVPTFTVEINGRNPRFIPEIERISEDCKLNREAAFLLPKISNDVYSIFQAGINGLVKDPFDNAIPDALVNITGKGRNLEFKTDESGEFFLNLEPGTYNIRITARGGLENTTTTRVRLKTYEDVKYILVEKIPPEVGSVNVTLNGSDIDRVEWGENVVIKVTEEFSERNLTGWVSVYGTGTQTEEFRLDLEDRGTHYEANWNTSFAQPWTYYSFEAALKDLYGNMDLNGSIPEAPDDQILVQDTTPPSVSNLELSGTLNPDGSFELHTDIQVRLPLIPVKPPEKMINGSLRIYHDQRLLNITEMRINGLKTELSAQVRSDDLDRGSFKLVGAVSDGFGNQVIRIANFSISDTTAPDFSLYLSEGILYPHDAGKQLHIQLVPDEREEGMTPWVEISMEEDGNIHPSSNITGHVWNQPTRSFLFTWNTTGLQTGTYYLEGRLKDGDGNYHALGAREEQDLTVLLKDVTPPFVKGVWIDGTSVEPGSEHNITGSFSIRVAPLERESDLECSLAINDGDGFLLSEIKLTEGTDGSFTALIDNGSIPFGTVYLELFLSDRWGNTDPDGFGPGPDLKITLNRKTVEVVSIAGSNLETGETFIQDHMEWVLADELLVFQLVLSNSTLDDAVHFLVGSSIIPVEPIIEENGHSLYELEVNTTERIGAHEARWKVYPRHLEPVEPKPFLFTVVEKNTDFPIARAITGWTDLMNGRMIVNISFDPPNGADELRIYAIYGENDGIIPYNLIATLPGYSNNDSFEVRRENVTFLVTAMMDLFPEEADRSIPVESYLGLNGSEGGSMISFYPPVRKDSDIIDDDEGKGPILEIALILSISAFLLIVIVFLLFMIRREGSSSSWDME